MTKKFAAEVVNEMLSLYQQGMPRWAIARQFNVRTTSISRVLARNGIGPGQRGSNGKIAADQHPRIVDQYQAGASLNALAKEYGCCIQAIRYILVRRNVTMRPQGALGPTLPREDITAIIDRYLAGVSQDTLAKAFNVTQTTISKLLRAENIPVRQGTRRQAHGNWKGGHTKTPQGYWAVLMEPDHPLAAMRPQTGYILEHRLVMAEHLKRPLLSYETVHHINGDKSDNRIENLELRIGKHGKGVVLVCACCGSTNIVAKAMNIQT